MKMKDVEVFASDYENINFKIIIARQWRHKIPTP